MVVVAGEEDGWNDGLAQGLEAKLDEADIVDTLRPRTLADFVGQPQLKEHLSIVLEAARRRGQPADHLLFAGPPGLGKTSLASIVATEMAVGFRITSGPALERAGDLAAILTNLAEGDVLFIDEIHRLPRAVEEVLYPAMEDFQLDIVIGKGPSARSLRLDLPQFTLIGATTRAGLITGPLRDRFGHVARLDYYSVDDLHQIVERAARIFDIEIQTEGAHEIARRSRGTPRIANRLLRRIRDYAQVRADGVINLEAARKGLVVFDIDELGLDRVDRAILQSICTRFGGGPVGLSTLAISIGEDSDTLESMYEPFLMQMGLIKRTQKGRVALPAAWEHLGLIVPDAAQKLWIDSDPDAPAGGDRTLF
jgi:holliday junction DNA helicase RuvB